MLFRVRFKNPEEGVIWRVISIVMVADIFTTGYVIKGTDVECVEDRIEN